MNTLLNQHREYLIGIKDKSLVRELANNYGLVRSAATKGLLYNHYRRTLKMETFNTHLTNYKFPTWILLKIIDYLAYNYYHHYQYHHIHSKEVTLFKLLLISKQFYQYISQRYVVGVRHQPSVSTKLDMIEIVKKLGSPYNPLSAITKLHTYGRDLSNIQKLPKECFEQIMGKLTYLELDEYYIYQPEYKAMCEMISVIGTDTLRKLHLSCVRQVSSTLFPLLSRFKNLEVLVCYVNNDTYAALPTLLASLPKLRKLGLSGYSENTINALSQYKSIQKIIIRNTITSRIPVHIKSATAVYGTLITSVFSPSQHQGMFDYFQHLEHLELYVSLMNIDIGIMAQYAKLPSLKSFQVSLDKLNHPRIGELMIILSNLIYNQERQIQLSISFPHSSPYIRGVVKYFYDQLMAQKLYVITHHKVSKRLGSVLYLTKAIHFDCIKMKQWSYIDNNDSCLFQLI